MAAGFDIEAERRRRVPARLRPARRAGAHAARPAAGRAGRRARPGRGARARPRRGARAARPVRPPQPARRRCSSRRRGSSTPGRWARRASTRASRSRAAAAARARSRSGRARARSAACAGEPRDVAVRLERNEWNGTVEPRLVLRALCEPRAGAFDVLDDALGLRSTSSSSWRARSRRRGGPAARQACDRRGEGVAGVLGDLLASGDDVLIACGEPQRWRRGLDSTLAGLARGRAAIASWDLLALLPCARHAVPARLRARPAAGGRCRRVRRGPAGRGLRPLRLGAGGGGGCARVHRGPQGPARGVARVYRALREAGPAALGELDPVLDPSRRAPTARSRSACCSSCRSCTWSRGPSGWPTPSRRSSSVARVPRAGRAAGGRRGCAGRAAAPFAACTSRWSLITAPRRRPAPDPALRPYRVSLDSPGYQRL